MKLVAVKEIFTSADCRSLTSFVGKLCEEAAVVVWAFGYSSNVLPICGPSGEPLRPLTRGGTSQVEVDSCARLIYKPVPQSPGREQAQEQAQGQAQTQTQASGAEKGAVLPGLFGTGLGFGLKPHLFLQKLHGLSASNICLERADGFAMYVKRAASLVLGGVLGSRVFGEGATSWEERMALSVSRKLQQARSPTRRPSTKAVFSTPSSPRRISIVSLSPSRATAEVAPGPRERLALRRKSKKSTDLRSPTKITHSPKKESAVTGVARKGATGSDVEGNCDSSRNVRQDCVSVLEDIVLAIEQLCYRTIL